MCVFNANDKVRPRERAVMWEGSFMSAKKTLTVSWYAPGTHKVALRETGDSNLFPAADFVLHKMAPMTGRELTIISECISELVVLIGNHPQTINTGECDMFADKLIKMLEQCNLYASEETASVGECEHTFVVFKGRFFDAESLYGQSVMWDLPTFIRAKQDGNNKEIKRIWAK